MLLPPGGHFRAVAHLQRRDRVVRGSSQRAGERLCGAVFATEVDHGADVVHAAQGVDDYLARLAGSA